MSTPYVGEIRIFAGNSPPNGWLFCQGQLLPISENETLFQLIGTTYGGDGQSSFGLPNLSGRLPVHQGTGSGGTTYQMGEAGGVESVTLSTGQMPSHSHAYAAIARNGTQISPQGNLAANVLNISPYINGPPEGPMNAGAISSAGGAQPHDNLQPFLCVNFIISLFGIFPTQN